MRLGGVEPTACITASTSSSVPNSGAFWTISARQRPSSARSSIGWRPAWVSCTKLASCRPRQRATATAVPSEGCPANGISLSTVKIRLR